jgi:hypothetical protein
MIKIFGLVVFSQKEYLVKLQERRKLERDLLWYKSISRLSVRRSKTIDHEADSD